MTLFSTRLSRISSFSMQICLINEQILSIQFKEATWYVYEWDNLVNQCLSPLMLLVRISTRARFTTLCNKVCQWLAAGRLFSPGHPVSSTNITNRGVNRYQTYTIISVQELRKSVAKDGYSKNDNKNHEHVDIDNIRESVFVYNGYRRQII